MSSLLILPKFADLFMYVGIQRNGNRLQSFSQLKCTLLVTLYEVVYTYIYVCILIGAKVGLKPN